MILQLDRLEKTYAHGSTSVTVLKDLTFEAAKAETIAILGPSGSGKSTLLSLLAGLDKPTSGTISVHGENLHEMGEEQLSRFPK